MFTSKLIKTHYLRIIWKIKAVFRLFDCCIFSGAILLSCGIARPVIQAETGVTASARVISSGE